MWSGTIYIERQAWSKGLTSEISYVSKQCPDIFIMTNDMEKAKGYVGISKFRKNYIKKNKQKKSDSNMYSVYFYT